MRVCFLLISDLSMFIQRICWPEESYQKTDVHSHSWFRGVLQTQTDSAQSISNTQPTSQGKNNIKTLSKKLTFQVWYLCTGRWLPPHLVNTVSIPNQEQLKHEIHHISSLISKWSLLLAGVCSLNSAKQGLFLELLRLDNMQPLTFTTNTKPARPARSPLAQYPMHPCVGCR